MTQAAQLKQQAKSLLRRLGNVGTDRCTVDVAGAGQSFHYLVDELGVVYMVLCGRDYPKKLAFAFLEEIYQLFREELKREFGTHSVDYRSRIDTLDKPYYFIKFERQIVKKQKEFRDPKSNQKLVKLNDSLSEVQNVMRKNLDEILQKTDKLENIGSKASSLRDKSQEYAQSAKMLKLQAMLKKYAVYLTLLMIIAFIIWWKMF